MNFCFSFIISFFFIFFTPTLVIPGEIEGCSELEQKTSIVLARTIATQEIIQKLEPHPKKPTLKVPGSALSSRKSPITFQLTYDLIEVSNFVFSGAHINQYIAST